ncbi:MAG: L,D-transpeptidase [Gammaproteobacteria bacterium]
MRSTKSCVAVGVTCLFSLALASCSTYTGPSSQSTQPTKSARATPAGPPPNYASRIPKSINTGVKTVVIDPNVHVWGAYAANGELVKAGLTTAGGNWCADIGRSCRTRPGTFHVNSLGSANCKSSIYPKPRGGAPMPYCMFFNGSQGLHGSYEVVEGNVSHGCVRLRVADAEWLRFNFINVGTKVVVKPY